MRKILVLATVLVVVAAAFALGTLYRQAGEIEEIEMASSSLAEKRLADLKKERPAEFNGPEGEAAAERYLAQFRREERFNALLEREAESKGVKVSDSDVEELLGQVKNSFTDAKQFLISLKEQGVTLAEYRLQIEENILKQRLMEKVTAGVKVTAAEVREYYDANLGRFTDAADPSKKTSFEKVSKMIESELLSEKRSERFQQYIQGLWDELGE